MVNHKDKPRDKHGKFVKTGITKKVAPNKVASVNRPVRPTVSSPSTSTPAYVNQMNDMAAYLAKKANKPSAPVVADVSRKPEVKKPYTGIKTKDATYKVAPVRGVKHAVAAFAPNGNVQVTPAVLTFQVKALNGNTVSCRWANERPYGKFANEATVNRPRALAA